MLPAKTPMQHISSCYSILSSLITAVKLCVVFVRELQCVDVREYVCWELKESLCVYVY